MKRFLGLAFVLSFPLSQAAAESIAVVAVDGCAQELTSSSARLLRTALVAQGASVKTEEETLAALGGAALGSLEDANRLIESAQVSFVEDTGRDKNKALAALAQAMAILNSLPPSDARWKSTAEAASMRAQILLFRGERAKAEQALEPIVRVYREFQVDQERYPPDMWKLADKVRRTVQDRATATLSVTTQPAGIPVWVDGRKVGAGPVLIELPPGEYRVEGSFGNQRNLARTVRLKDAAAVQIDQDFDGMVRVGSGPCLRTSGTRQARLTALIKLSAFLEVNEMVGIWQEEPDKGEVYLTAASVNGGNGQEIREAKVNAGAGTVPPEAIGKLAQFVSAGRAAGPVVAVVTKPQPVPQETRDPSAHPDTVGTVMVQSSRPGLRTSSYVSGGLAVAALGIGAYGFLKASSARSEIDALKVNGTYPAGTEVRRDELQKQASSAKTIGYVGVGVGVAAAGAGVGLYLYSSQPLADEGKGVKVGLAPDRVTVSMRF